MPLARYSGWLSDHVEQRGPGPRGWAIRGDLSGASRLSYFRSRGRASRWRDENALDPAQPENSEQLATTSSARLLSGCPSCPSSTPQESSIAPDVSFVVAEVSSIGPEVSSAGSLAPQASSMAPSSIYLSEEGERSVERVQEPPDMHPYQAPIHLSESHLDSMRQLPLPRFPSTGNIIPYKKEVGTKKRRFAVKQVEHPPGGTASLIPTIKKSTPA